MIEGISHSNRCYHRNFLYLNEENSKNLLSYYFSCSFILQLFVNRIQHIYITIIVNNQRF